MFSYFFLNFLLSSIVLKVTRIFLKLKSLQLNSLESSFQHATRCYAHRNSMSCYHRELSLRYKVTSDNTNINCIELGLQYCNHRSLFWMLTWGQSIKHHNPRQEKECWSHSEEHVATGFATSQCRPVAALPKLQSKWEVITAPVFPS